MASTIELSRDVHAISQARRWLVSELTDAAPDHPEILEKVLVMASELVSNVLMHTTSAPRLQLSRAGDGIRLEVVDDDPGAPEVRERSPLGLGGNGLKIVDSWSRKWGVDRRPGHGKAVWFEVAI